MGAKARGPKERMISNEKTEQGISKDGRRRQKCMKRIATLLKVIILRTQREKMTGGQRIDKESTRITNGRVEMNGVCRRNLEVEEEPKTRRGGGDQRRYSETRIWRIRGMGLCGSARAQAMICAGSSRRNQCPMPGKKRFVERIRWMEAGIETGVNTGA